MRIRSHLQGTVRTVRPKKNRRATPHTRAHRKHRGYAQRRAHALALSPRAASALSRARAQVDAQHGCSAKAGAAAASVASQAQSFDQKHDVSGKAAAAASTAAASLTNAFAGLGKSLSAGMNKPTTGPAS